MSNPKEWAAKVRNELFLRGMSQKDLADGCGASYGVVRALLRGDGSAVSKITEDKINSFLGMEDE